MSDDLTRDAFLGGRLHLYQPKRGYRAGIDPVLLAASVPAKAGQSVLDLGCGVGTAALCLGVRVPGLDLHGVERDQDYAALAELNGLTVTQADLASLPKELLQRSFDHVLANPPFFDRNASTKAESHLREAAHGEETPLADWVDAAARRAGPRGMIHFIHRMSRLPELMSLVAPRLGGVTVLPIQTRSTKEAKLFILHAQKDARADFKLLPPLILHDGPVHVADGESYTSEINEVLRNGSALPVLSLP